MSKVEERTLQEYPKIIKRYRKLGDTEENTGSEYDENLEQRCIYIKGYHQAEKDLELTWEDLATIEKLSNDFVKHNQTPMSDEEFYKEVLKRFKNLKELCKI